MKKTITKIKPKRILLQPSDSALKGSIVIDDNKNLVFRNEEELLKHFEVDVEVFEKEFLAKRPKTDFTDDESEKYFECLDILLDDPDEVWEDHKSLKEKDVSHFIRKFIVDGQELYYVAVAHMVDEHPMFVYLHFPTKFSKVAERYRRGDLIFDRVIKEVENAAIEGDSLGEGDELAVGLYKAMMKLRSDTDIPEADFNQYGDMRELTIEEADEIWRTPDYSGQTLVHFIKELSESEAEEDLYYIVVTVEEASSSSHALLFSFPTRDTNLVDRYRNGENLQAEEVVQEASH